jgi:hypothetical protein
VKRSTITATLLCLAATAAQSEESYIAFDDAGNMVLTGPFELTIPRPGDARPGGPRQTAPSLLDEQLTVSTAGYFGTDQFVIVQVETTNAGPGTMSNEFLPVMTLAGEEFRAREACVDISQEQLDADTDPLFEFVEEFDVQVVPAVMAMQLLAVDPSGAGLGTILFMRNVKDGCESVTPEFKDKFTGDFERFIAAVRAAN